MVPLIPAPALSRYNYVSRNRGGQAVAPVVGGMCRCCRLSIPPQLYNELQKSDKLIACPNCARILWWMHHPYFKDFCTEPEPTPAGAAPEKPENGRKDKTARTKAAKASPEAEGDPDAGEVGKDPADSDDTTMEGLASQAGNQEGDGGTASL
jgi:hypothetical protein